MRMQRLLAALLLALTAAPALAQDKPASAMTRDEARVYFEQYISHNPRIDGCGDNFFIRKAQSVVFAEAGLTITCNGGKTRTVQFADRPFTWIIAHGRRALICVSDRDEKSREQKRCGDKNLLVFFEIEDAQRFVDAWAGLQRPPPPPHPEFDAAFQEGLRLTRASTTDRTEDQRRTQVQVEALVGAGKTKEAATLYRDALKTSPDWASGHYNLALLAGDLPDYTEAITEMRRYLYLEPMAADARAAQDQIYKWEALLATTPLQ